ncbi:deoxyribodipyrimidine photolyase [Leptolyngbya sp. 'hensonii']|nr:deoxyribodipyrimidine photolyase [Leptolyngbya sp. 'hensonii']
MNRTIVWFRRDLRISDHAPLYRAARRGAVIPVFVFDRALLYHPETGVARVAFLLEALKSLDQDLRSRGGRLILRFGDPVTVLPCLIQETEAEGIYAYTDCERIYGRVRDAHLNQTLTQQHLKIRWFEPCASTSELIPYPAYRDWWFAEMATERVPAPERVEVPEEVVSNPLPTVTELGLIPDGKPIPPASTAFAYQLLQEFFDHKADRYYWQLSYPSAMATTGLSPHLKFGLISTRECIHQIRQLQQHNPSERVQRSAEQLTSRLRWGNGFTQRFRYLPQLELRSLYSIFDQEGWDFNETWYQAWQEGQTGFPIIDAAARCLQATGGWLELNFRSRAIYASFLTNLLGMDWRYGALHFMRHLIDGDCPIDHYQWAMQAGVTHCANKKWTRIYNPQQVAIDRCDPEGHFIQRWVPELAHLPPSTLGHPPVVKGYPAPILNYKQARQQRVRKLERQRGLFLDQENIVPYLAQLPEDYLPFGADRVTCTVDWAVTKAPQLFPVPLDLNSLDLEQAKALRSWFVTQVEIKPAREHRRKASSKSRSTSFQLSLLS